MTRAIIERQVFGRILPRREGGGGNLGAARLFNYANLHGSQPPDPDPPEFSERRKAGRENGGTRTWPYRNPLPFPTFRAICLFSLQPSYQVLPLLADSFFMDAIQPRT